jgi:hypothetical protein
MQGMTATSIWRMGSLNIYTHGASYCIIPRGSGNTQDTYHSDYFRADYEDNGYVCETNRIMDITNPIPGKDRRAGLLEFLKNKVGIGLP